MIDNEKFKSLCLRVLTEVVPVVNIAVLLANALPEDRRVDYYAHTFAVNNDNETMFTILAAACIYCGAHPADIIAAYKKVSKVNDSESVVSIVGLAILLRHEGPELLKTVKATKQESEPATDAPRVGTFTGAI